MPTAFVPARTVDDVISRLETIIEDCIAARDRLGYFAALYNRVTLAVRDGIQQGQFDDGPRMERLDVTFANRYLEAHAQYLAGELPSRSWCQAFTAAASAEPVVLQHLLLGMNAHISLDLGVAAARTCPGASLAALHGDFNRINTVLATLTPVVEQELQAESSAFNVLTHLAPRLELKLVGFAMDEARDQAWTFARELASVSPREQVPLMARRDMEASLLSDVILHERLLTLPIRLTESADVAANIRTLAGGEFRIRIPAPAPATRVA